MADLTEKSHQPDKSLPSVKYREFGSKLSWKTKIFYSFGHVYNDLCASIWFSYTLLYFKLSFNDTIAGLLLFLGQVTDAISTPIVGYGSDKNLSFLGRHFGRRKVWHLIGSVFVTCSFPLIFNSCMLCSNASLWEKFLYYSIFIALFQFGWAAVQVAHLSLITDLSDDSSERIELNSYRQAATVMSSICVYSITLIFLGTEDSTIDQNDSIVFMKVVHLITLIGIVFSVLFHVFVKEPKVEVIVEFKNLETIQSDNSPVKPSYSINVVEDEKKPELLESNLSATQVEVVTIPEFTKPLKRDRDHRIWSDWLKSVSFWKICLIYMMSRLYVNVTQVYTPLYLQETLLLAKRNIAIVPFITYFAGFLFSLVGKSKRINSRIIMCFGCIFSFLSCIWLWFSFLEISIWEVFLMAAIFGVGGTFMLIGSLSLTADLINTNKVSGAFVYGLMSFFDKLVNGAVIALVQHLKPSSDGEESQVVNETISSVSQVTSSPVEVTTQSSEQATVFYLYVLVFVSGAAVVFTFLSLISIMQKELKKLVSYFTPATD